MFKLLLNLYILQYVLQKDYPAEDLLIVSEACQSYSRVPRWETCCQTLCFPQCATEHMQARVIGVQTFTVVQRCIEASSARPPRAL